jgi:hypothetical protein
VPNAKKRPIAAFILLALRAAQDQARRHDPKATDAVNGPAVIMPIAVLRWPEWSRWLYSRTLRSHAPAGASACVDKQQSRAGEAARRKFFRQ